MGAPAVAVAITAAERRLVRRLRGAGARSAATAQPLPTTRPLEAGRLERLLEAGAIREAEPGRYYVDDEGYAAYRGDRRAVIVAVLLVLIALTAILVLYVPRRAW